tara:strand:- start:327 stop:452 length:126 start_codon:yes stop_codon:yes gene_type:complete
MFIKNIKDTKIYASAVKAGTFVNGSVGLSADQPNEIYVASH